MIRKCVPMALGALMVGIFGASCVTVVDPGDGGDGGGDTTNLVTIRMINASPAQAVDVQLYVAGPGVTNADTELFIPANKQLAGIGFAGSGILQPGQVDEIQVDCSVAGTIGTLGGAFLDVDTGAQIGAGTRYAFWQGGQFQCGATITFTYAPSGSGFRTDVSVAGP